MTKAELIGAVAEKSGLKKADAEKAVAAFVSVVSDCLKDGDRIGLVGFGTFSVSKRAARKGKNPKTGEPLVIEAATVPRFKPGKVLRDLVNI